MSVINPISLPRAKKYTKLLNNLLAITIRDQCLFTRLNRSCFDITSKFGLQYSNKILSQKEITLKLTEVDYSSLVAEIKKAKKSDEIIKAYQNYRVSLNVKKKAQLQDKATFLSTKKELIDKLKTKIQQAKRRWMQFNRQVLDANIEENIWQLHVATFFITTKTSSKELYCPLILREVKLEVDDANITITNLGPWKINEKALFILKENGFGIDETTYFENLAAINVIALLAKQLNLSFDFNIIAQSFNNIMRDDVKTKTITVHSGVVLGMFKPGGGSLRKTMMKIIKNEEVDDILDIEVDKNIYQKRVNEAIENENTTIIKIQKTNFCQDKAIISALQQNTMIWGPPGTGKSQVIVNIIANILFENKTAIVMSQKKAALDVLKKRLQAVAPFVLFILNDNNMNKSEFYKPLQKFVQLIENSLQEENTNKNIIISQSAKTSLKQIWHTIQENGYEASLKIIAIVQENDELLQEICALNPHLIYPEQPTTFKEYLKWLAAVNKINKKSFLGFKYYPKELKKQAKLALTVIAKLNHNLNELMKYTKKTTYKTIINLRTAGKNLNYQPQFKSDMSFLIQVLSRRMITKIGIWKLTKHPFYQQYKSFANAVRAGRRLTYKFLNDHISVLKALFPVIVTTPETGFINWEKNYFDYAIVDESSQIFLEVGLPILYLAKIKILAGDPQQLKPSRWFATRDDSETDADVAENAFSILDYALDKGIYKIMLQQNFRSSKAALMSFSAKHFYECELHVIDENLQNQTHAISVENINGMWENGVNKAEATAAIIKANSEIDNYNKVIILTFNVLQRQLIEKMIIESAPKLYECLITERLLIRNIENIQGDEADLIIISVVYDRTTNIASTYVAKSNIGKNALNVAISRAKHKIIVLKSIDEADIKINKNDDLAIFKAWLKFITFSEAEKQSYSSLTNNTTIINSESNFKTTVRQALTNLVTNNSQYHLITEFKVGNKTITFVIFDQENNYILGILLDNYRYGANKMTIDSYLEDLSNQTFLETKGYFIYRIKEIDWNLDKAKIIAEIKTFLTNYQTNSNDNVNKKLIFIENKW